MKKIIFCLLVFVMTIAVIPVQAFTEGKKDPSSLVVTKPPEKNELREVKILESRLGEIKAMDKSKLSSSEKKSLRKEVHSIKRKLKDISGGVYISAGTLLVILILLIVLL